MRTHASTTQALVGGTGRMKRRIVPGGILALSLAVVLLAATASSASAEELAPWYCPPLPTPPTDLKQFPPEGCLDSPSHRAEASFDFGDRQVGTTSPGQRFALLFGPDDFPGPQYQTLTPSISVSGDYAQTNSCPPTISPAWNSPEGIHLVGCIITVTFAPTGTGPRRGTLSTGTEPRPGRPGSETAALSGRGATTPTPPALPLWLSADAGRGLAPAPRTVEKKVTIRALTNNDSTVVAKGGVKRTTKRLAASEETKIKARLKHVKRLRARLEHRKRLNVEIKLAATDEFDQTATEKTEAWFCRQPVGRVCGH
jgi:hypothetical protein